VTARGTLSALLDTYQDALDAVQRNGDIRGGGNESVVLLMSNLWHEGSYAELERGLKDMRANSPVLYWNVAETYTRAPTKLTTGCPVCKQETTQRHRHKDGATFKKVAPQRISIRVVSKAVRPVLVQDGITWLERWFEARGVTPFLPRELYESVAA
jgi:hypothetical protein